MSRLSAAVGFGMGQLFQHIGYSLWRDVIEGYGNSLIFQEERKQVIRQLSMQTEHSRQVSEAAAENRRLIHDIKHHLRTIDRILSERGK